MSKALVEKGNLYDHIFREKEIMNETNGHPFISKLYSTCKDDNNLYFIIEIASGGNLFELCNDREKTQPRCDTGLHSLTCIRDRIYGIQTDRA